MSPKKLSEVAPTTEHVRLDELVGKYILITRVEPASSLQYGRGVRLEFLVCDEKGVPYGETLYDAMSFGPGVRRKLEALQGGAEFEIWQDPEGVLAKVEQIGQSLQLT